MYTKDKIRKRIKVFQTVLKLLLLLFIVVGLPLYIYFCHHEYIDMFSNMENVNAFFAEHKTKSIFFYIGAQILQIVICIIPGQWLQFAAGYMYGFWLGYLFSLIGAFLGTVLTYYIAKILGHDALHLIFGEEKVHKLLKTLNSKKAVVLVFIIFLIPGVPKDLCNYVAGVSHMKLKLFLAASLVGRTPAMMGSLLIGRFIYTGEYTGAIIIGVFAVIFCVLGLVFRKKLTNLLNKAYDKLIKA